MISHTYILHTYICLRQGRINRKGEKRCGPSRSEKIGKNAAAYAAEQLVLQEFF